MPDMRYFNYKDKFLDYAWDIYSEYYDSREDFISQFEKISTDEEKNLFLKIASFYKFLIKDGRFTIQHEGEEEYVEYFDVTYKFIALMAFIEALFLEDRYLDFFSWLNIKKRRSEVFPINDRGELEEQYRKYKSRYGASQKAEKFFDSLDNKAQKFLSARIKVDNEYKPTEELAKLLYGIRSEFVHNARLIVEFIKGGMLSTRRNQRIMSFITFGELVMLFEEGLLHQFGFSPESRKL